MRNVFRRRTKGRIDKISFPFTLSFRFLFLSTLVIGCSEQGSGPIQVELIHPTGPGCVYSISPASVDTLTSLSSVQGLVGSVVMNPDNLGITPSILDTGAGFSPVTVQFFKSGGAYYPLDFNSLFAVSLYYDIEKGYELFAGLDPMADMSVVVPNFSSTLIVDEAKRTFGPVGQKPEVADNAEYLPHEVEMPDGTSITKNYFLSYPSKSVTQMPLGLNLGIMVHEYTHMVFHYLFYQPAFAQNEKVDSTKPTAHTLASLDEGLADYFGYLSTGDPSFFECSFPQEDRDLSVPKAFTDQVIADINSSSNFDPHEGGAVFAAINYEIGNVLGDPKANGRYLIHFMASLLNCPQANSGPNKLSLDFGAVAACQIQAADPSAQPIIQQVYSKYLGAYGGSGAGP